MNIHERWQKLQEHAGMYLSPEARQNFTYRLTQWNDMRRRRAPAFAEARRRLEDWLKLHLDWWERLWGDERESLSHLKLKAMGIDPPAAVARQKREVQACFRARIFPAEVVLFEKHLTARCIQEPGLISRHVFTFLGNPPHCLGPSIDWNADPFFDIEWPSRLQRHYAWVTLGAAYRATRRDCYVQAWARQFIDWASRNPMQSWTRRAFAWSTLNAAVRALTWSTLIPAMVRSPLFTPEVLLLFLAALRHNMNFLMEHAARSGNWILYESEGLVRIGACFQEFKQSSVWRQEGCRRLNREIRRQVLPDGAHMEFCPGYHAGILGSFHSPMLLARQYGFATRFGPDYRKRLRKAYRFFAFTAKPDGVVLPIGDTSQPRNCRQLVFQGAREFDDPALLFAATGGREGRPPKSSCLVFRNSGHIVMRDAWQKIRRFLFFDVAPHGGWHSHRDSLQVLLWAFGEDLLVDSGCYRYSEPEHSEYGKTWRHNTVTVDEQNQNLFRPVLAGWKSREDFTYAAGLSRQWSGVQHLREVIFLNSAFWLVLDLLISDGFHAFQQWWHFGQSRVTAVQKNQYRSSNLLLVPAEGDNVRLQKGEVVNYNKKWFRPVLCVEKHGRGLVGFATLLYPHRKGEAPKASFMAFKPSATPEGRFQVSVNTPLGTTTVVCSGPWKRRKVICR